MQKDRRTFFSSQFLHETDRVCETRAYTIDPASLNLVNCKSVQLISVRLNPYETYLVGTSQSSELASIPLDDSCLPFVKQHYLQNLNVSFGYVPRRPSSNLVPKSV